MTRPAYVVSMREIFSIGYAQYTRDHLLERLREFGITALADIRTYRSSSYWTAFDSESFGPFLRAHGIAYVFLGDQLGGKPQIEALYPNERLDYARLARRDFFQAGLDRVENGAEKFTLCLMCAEKDPLECHRGLLLAPELAKRQVNVTHILYSGKLERHRDSERRMVALHRPKIPDLFGEVCAERELTQAYDAQRRRMAPRWKSKKST